MICRPGQERRHVVSARPASWKSHRLSAGDTTRFPENPPNWYPAQIKGWESSDRLTAGGLSPHASAARSASSLEATLEGGATAARFPDAKPEAEGPQLTGVLTTFPLGEGKGLTPTRKQVTGAISASRDTRGLQCRPPASEQGACLVVSQALLRPVPSMQRPGRTFQVSIKPGNFH